MKRYPLGTFFFLAFAISWLAALLLHLIARQAGLANFGELMRRAETTFTLGEIAAQLPMSVTAVFLLTRVIDFGPTLAGLLTPFLLGNPAEARAIVSRLFDFRLAGRWYGVAILLPLAVVLSALGLHLVLGESAITIVNWHGWLTIGQLLFWVVLMRTLLGGGLGEELGWRGFALPRLMTQHSPFRATLILGLVWTFWHLPSHLVGSNPLVSFIVQLLFTLPISFIFTWFYYQVEGRLFPLVLMHGAFNGFNAFFEQALLPPLANEDGFVIFFILVVLILGIWAAVKVRRLPTPSLS